MPGAGSGPHNILSYILFLSSLGLLIGQPGPHTRLSLAAGSALQDISCRFQTRVRSESEIPGGREEAEETLGGK